MRNFLIISFCLLVRVIFCQQQGQNQFNSQPQGGQNQQGQPQQQFAPQGQQQGPFAPQQFNQIQQQQAIPPPSINPNQVQQQGAGQQQGFGAQQQQPFGQQQGQSPLLGSQQQPNTLGQGQQPFGQGQGQGGQQPFGQGQGQQPFGQGQGQGQSFGQGQGQFGQGQQQPGAGQFGAGAGQFGAGAGQFGGAGGQQVAVAGAPAVVMTTDLVAVDKATPIRQLFWQEPEMSQVYCVSQAPAQALRFTCATCNNTALMNYDALLNQNTQNLGDLAGFPAIKLTRMPVTGELWDKMVLRCMAFYPGPVPQGGGQANATADAAIIVAYLGKPHIVDSAGRMPLMEMDGSSRFYVQQGGATSLYCLATGNPPATQFQWFANGVLIGNAVAQQLNFQQHAGKALNCRATNAQGQQQSGNVPPNMWEESSIVMLETLLGPGIISSNFEDARKNALTGAVNGKTPLGKSVQLQCLVAGFPKPYVQWFQQSAPGKVINATCTNGGRGTMQEEPPNQNHPGVWQVSGECGLRMDTLEQSGDYWCAACVRLAVNFSLCIPATAPSGANVISFDLTGPPRISEHMRIEQLPNSDRVTLFATYCADPNPQANEIYWMVNNERLNLNNRLGTGIQAGASQQNQTFIDCYDVPLLFDNAAAVTSAHSYELHIDPAGGQHVQQSFQVSDMIAASNGTLTGVIASPYKASDPTGLIVGIIIGVLILLLILTCAFLWYKQKACFAPKRASNTYAPSGNKAKPKQGGGPKYQSNLVPSQKRAEPLPEKVPPLTRPNPDGYPSERTNIHQPTGGTGYSPSIRRTHEGLTYSEFDLVKDSNRPPPPGTRPVEYTRVQPNAGNLKSPTNSTV